MTLTRLCPEGVADSSPFGYIPSIRCDGPNRLWMISGQIGTSPEGPNDFESQMHRAFDRLEAVLASEGLAPSDVVRITLLVVDHDTDKLGLICAKRKSFFGSSLPTSTLIPVPCLALPDMVFEVDAIAVKEA
ncbi:RidA family protein [Pseudooceanicola sp. C21-150M6]|uniref:RidA family protein n=1 Tax=Pseudooceanicola sp. C21-150M6 TaxID=3434355 RepID=UPI003D7F5605